MAPSLRTCRDLLPTHNHISCRVLLALLAGLCMNSVHGADKPARRQITLRDGWLVKQLDTNKGDVAELARESATPDKT